MAYIPSECTKEQYVNAIYNADAQHKCYLSFGGVEYEDIDETLSKIVVTSNVLDSTQKVFMLNNLIAKSVEITIHEVDVSKIKDQIELKIGTYINDTIGYVYVPIGKFNLSETPTTNNGIMTIKARDNSIKLDKPYNAKQVIDANGGSATKKQILDDICSKFGVTHNITSFRGMSEEIGIYDSTINARIYVCMIAEQSGSIAYFDRNGILNFKKISDIKNSKWVLNIDDVSKYITNTQYTIKKVIYESGVTKYEKATFEYELTSDTSIIENKEYYTRSGSEPYTYTLVEEPTLESISTYYEKHEVDGDILYLDSANDYINNQEIVDGIYDIVKDFSIESLNIEKIYGNPAIDPFDLIECTDDDNLTHTSLGQNTLTYNGKCLQTFDTQISKEKKQTNVTKIENNDQTFKKWARTEINNIDATISLTVGKVESIEDNLEDNYYTKEQQEKLILDAQNGLTNIFSNSGGNNLLNNTQPWFGSDLKWDYWEGNLSRITELDSVSDYALLLQNGTCYQEKQLANAKYTISFKYKRLINTANAYVKYNNQEIALSKENGEIIQTFEITTQGIKFEMTCDTNGGFEIYDLMLNYGEVAMPYTQSANEIKTTNVSISENIVVESNIDDTITSLGTRGLEGRNKSTDELVFKQTPEGSYSRQVEADSGIIAGLSIKKVGEQVWLTGV